MIYCGELELNKEGTVDIGQFFAFGDSKTPLYKNLSGNITAGDIAKLVCTITKAGVQSSFVLSVNNFSLNPDSIASLSLAAGDIDTVGQLIISFDNATENQELIFPCSFWFDVRTIPTEKLNRILAAKSIGVWRAKAGVTGTYEILDAVDGETVVLEAAVSAGLPAVYTIKI